MPDTKPTATTELTGEALNFLRIYIRDHDGASSGGLHLARRCYDANRTTSLGPRLEQLVAAISDAQDELRRIAARLGIRPSLAREAATWVGSAVGALKLNGRRTTYSPLSRVVELEALSSAVTGQLRLWETLQRLAPFDHRLDTSEAQRYGDQCRALLEDLTVMHDSAAREAFTPLTDPQLATAHLTGAAQAAKNAAEDPPA